MQRLIITGANGSGKSHLAARCHVARPDVLTISIDAIKLTTQWQQRPRVEIERDLRAAVSAESWILEGGPSFLNLALPRADAIVWVDPPWALRAFRLLARPWKTRGTTRAELPSGNPDHIGQQYRFTWKSLRKERQFRRQIAATVAAAQCPVIGVTPQVDADGVVSLWSKGGPR